MAWLLTQSQGIACDNAGNYAAVRLIVVDNIQFSKALKEMTIVFAIEQEFARIDSDRMEFARISLSLESAFLCLCNRLFAFLLHGSRRK